MKKSQKRLAAVLGSITLVTALAACAADTTGSGGTGDGAASGKIAFLMPDLASTRYEQQDSPLFTAKMEELCPDCEIIYQNADSDPAKQQQQADSAIAQGVKVIVLDAVDTKAAASIVVNAQSQNIPVITYDRPIVDTPADYYVSFDNEGIGELISTSLVEGLAAAGASGGVLIVNGSSTDDAAQLIKKGIHTGVDSSDFEVLAEFDTPGWEPQKAQDWVSGQITQFGPQIVGVVAANDGTGGGSIAAFKAAGVTPTPPVTGNDAEIAAIQRIIAGDQYNTISKPIRIVAEAAAEVAYAFLTGNPPEGETTLFDTPSQLFTPEVVTQENVKEIIFDGEIYTVDEVCTAEYAAACEALGIA
ncbi:substrate-binding domain-containing protein [Agromyces albus]|uniref:substrate-binding domain-containing protein n=1 Tax=Agromyces albus TaxID=205332 RepID=UPI00278905D7|nr:substrate-binding domain-containing protein [Agromyces albus]MDQ0577026.1 D-xylose transport system substrate-binding protein [Agromyces albus]